MDSMNVKVTPEQFAASMVLLQQMQNLDNGISKQVTMPYMEGEPENMARHREHVTLPNGQQVWITGNNYSDMIGNALLRYGNVASIGAGAVTFREYVYGDADIFNTIASGWNPRVIVNNKRIMDKHLIPFFGDMPLNGITRANIQKFFNDRMNLSKSYQRQMKIILHQVLNMAVQDDLITKDPTTYKINLSQKVTVREAIELDQYNNIIENLGKLKPDDALMLAIFLFTGMRHGEVLGLRWENVTDNVIQVRAQATYQGNQPIFDDYTKTPNGMRDIPINEHLRPYLAQRGTGFVVGGGDKPITQSKFDRSWERIEKTINLYGAKPHILRHTFASALEASGCNLKALQYILGHSDFNFTMNRYVHKTTVGVDGAIRGMADFMAKCYGKVDTGNNAESVEK